jgi:protein involved in polysaccharide export with SLBB domain
VSSAIGRQYRGYTVSVNISKLRGIRVYVTGLANNPGAFTVSSLSTLANAVFQAGGPSSGGSWRSIKLYRNGHEVTDFDLYQLMRGGSRVNDILLQNEDVLFIPPAGDQVAVIGSVQEEAIYEAKPGESIADMLAAAGGPNTLADRSRVILYRTGEPDLAGPRQLAIGQTAGETIHGGDILQMLSSGSLIMPIDRQSVLVRVEGEVNHPGIYYIAPNTPSSEIIAKAGGLSSTAYAYGTRFTRQSVKIQQEESFREAIRQLEISLAAAPLTTDTSISAADRAAQIAGARAVLDRLRQAEPDGRVVLQITPDATALPGDIVLENNDAIYVPPRATTVGIFGAVYRPASFLVTGPGKPARVRDYVEKAGGPLRSADRGNTFVVRANGEVLSRKRDALDARVLPGDVIFVPVKTQGGTFWAKFKDITQTLFQLGLAAATVVAITK